MRVYCFGNEFFKEDSLAKEIADELSVPGFSFVKCDRPDDLFNEKELLILDVVSGIDDVVLIENMDDLQHGRIATLHDADLGFFLKLLNEIGQLGQVKIIGIPMQGDKEEIKGKVEEILGSMISNP